MPDPLRDPLRRASLRLATQRTAWVAGLFCAVLGGLLWFNSTRLYQGEGGRLRLVEGEALHALKLELREAPTDGALKDEIRRIDQQRRLEFFRRERLASRGGWMLLGGAVLFIAALQAHRWLGPPRAPSVSPQPEDVHRTQVASGRAVGGALLVLAGMTAALVAGAGRRWQEAANSSPAEPSAPAAEAADPGLPTPGRLAAQWPRFRGPGGLGVADRPGLPGSWNGETGAGVAWRTETPLPGENSPLVWDELVILTGANASQREVYGLAADSGRLLWTAPVRTPQGSRDNPPEVMSETGYAASTAVTDGRRVFAIFANGEAAGVTLDGRLLWARHLGEPRNLYGHAASLAMWQDRVIVVYDRGAEAEEGLSRILALDAANGETVWSTDRPVPNSWPSPIVIEVDGSPQVVTGGNPWVIAYDPRDGSEIWRADCLSGDVAPSPTFANGLVYFSSDGACLVAIRPDGRGDVTATHLEWKRDTDDYPDICSLLCDGPRVYTLVFGTLHAYDAMTGEAVWSHDLEDDFQASPSLVDGRLWLLTREGEMIVGTADGEGFHESGRFPLGEPAGASPAFAPGRIYLRGKKHLFAIGDDVD